MDGLKFVRELAADRPMPMAGHFGIRLVSVEQGTVTLEATPDASHTNPFLVAHGGFAATVLDMALGLCSVSALTGNESAIATTDLSVRYIRPITPQTGQVRAIGSIVHRGRTTIVAEARLEDAKGKLLATSQCTNIIVLEPEVADA